MIADHKFKEGPESWSKGRDECYASVVHDNPGCPAHGDTLKCGRPRREHLHVAHRRKEPND